MTQSTSKLKTVIFSLVWLAVVCGAAALAIAGRTEQGIFSYLAVGLAVVMLVLFAIAYLPRRLQRKAFTDALGKLFVGLLILFAIFILAAALIKGYKNFGLLGSAVLILFLFTFVRIFVSYVKDFNKRSGKNRRKLAGENEPNRDAEGESE